MPVYKVDGVKKDGLQKYNVRINYISDSGKAKQLTRTAYGLEQAKELERQLHHELKTKGEQTAKKMTFLQLYEEYISVKKYEIRESTLDKFKRNVGYHLMPFFKDVRIDRITVDMLKNWKLSVEEKNLKLKSKKNAYGDLRVILNYAVRMEYLAKNPLVKIGNFKDGSGITLKQEMGFYTPEQFRAFIGVARTFAEEKQERHKDLSEWHFYVFFNIAFYTGLRKGEIHALKWSDIDGSYLSVKRSVTQKLKGEDRETLPKNKSSVRTLQLPLPLIRVLGEHKERLTQSDGFSDDSRVCGNDRCLRDTTIQKRNVLYAETAGLKTIRIHDFRHSHVSVLANEGINIQEIARRLGHAKIEMTWNTYSHLYPREEEKAVDILNKIA